MCVFHFWCAPFVLTIRFFRYHVPRLNFYFLFLCRSSSVRSHATQQTLNRIFGVTQTLCDFEKLRFTDFFRHCCRYAKRLAGTKFEHKRKQKQKQKNTNEYGWCVQVQFTRMTSKSINPFINGRALLLRLNGASDAQPLKQKPSATRKENGEKGGKTREKEIENGVCGYGCISCCCHRALFVVQLHSLVRLARTANVCH